MNIVQKNLVGNGITRLIVMHFFGLDEKFVWDFDRLNK